MLCNNCSFSCNQCINDEADILLLNNLASIAPSPGDECTGAINQTDLYLRCCISGFGQIKTNDRHPLSARLNIDADFLATRSNTDGTGQKSGLTTLWISSHASIHVHGTPVTSQYYDCIRFHVNGYHHRQYVHRRHGWTNWTWESIDFYVVVHLWEAFQMTWPHSSGTALQRR